MSSLPDNKSSRKLMAILFADIMGYTALMQSDEPAARRSLEKFRATCHQKVDHYNGKIVNFYGDGCVCAFDSALDAVNCAREMQIRFKSEPVIPVRMGLHSGDVFFEAENIYGDGVNLASRIESVSVPGAVLLSEKVRDEIKNQPDLTVVSMGNFELKNVKIPLELYAMTNEGLTVPKPEELQSKIRQQTSHTYKSKRRLILGILGILVIFLIAIWKLGVFNVFSNLGTSEFHSPLPEEVREKRVVVMVFENETDNSSLDAFGKMISDWLTKGLMETEEANVISAANILNKLDSYNPGDIGSHEFSESTGIGVILLGRYYLQEDELIINSNVVDAENGEVLHAFDLIRDHKGNILSMLEQLTQEVLGYWAVKKHSRFSQNPPKYEAYQEFIKGGELYISNPKQAEKHFQNSFLVDSNFFAPLFNLYALYNKEGKDSLKIGVIKFLGEKVNSFSKWEKLRYEELKALEARDYLAVAQWNERRYQMDASDFSANYNASVAYNMANYPRKALALIHDFDMRLLNQENLEISWHSANEAYSQYAIGNYGEVHQLAMNYSFPKIADALAVLHLKSLIRMDSTELLHEYFETYTDSEIYSTSGKSTPIDQVILLVCDELFLMNKNELLRIYVGQLREIMKVNPDHSNYYKNMGYAYFYSEEYAMAPSFWEKEELFTGDVPGWMRFPQLLDKESRIGYCYGIMGEDQKAKAQFNLIKSYQIDHPDLSAVQKYYSARILAALGRNEDAVSSLNQAVKEGFPYFRPAVFKSDPFLKPLIGYIPFKELIEPKG